MTDTTGSSAGESTGGSEASAQEFLSSLASETGGAREDARQAREIAAQNAKQFEQIQRAFTGEKEAAPDETAWYNEMLDALMEAEKQGKPMPMTARLGTVAYENQKKALALESQVAELRNMVKQLSDPRARAEQLAYAHMDDAITTTLEGMYGEVPMAFHNAVSSEVESVLREIQKSAPQKWEQLRRSETAQKKLVQHCAQKLVPPKAREFLLQKHESERDTTAQDFQSAWNEIRALERAAAEGKLSAKEVAAVQRDKVALRQKELEYRYNGPERYNRAPVPRRAR